MGQAAPIPAAAHIQALSHRAIQTVLHSLQVTAIRQVPMTAPRQAEAWERTPMVLTSAAATVLPTVTVQARPTVQVRARQALPVPEIPPRSVTAIPIRRVHRTGNPHRPQLQAAERSRTAKAAATAGAEVLLTALPALHQAVVPQVPVHLMDTAAEHPPDAVHRILPDQVTATAAPTAGLREHRAAFHKDRATVHPTVLQFPIQEVLRQAAEKRLQARLRSHRVYLTAHHTAVRLLPQKEHRTVPQIL